MKRMRILALLALLLFPNHTAAEPEKTFYDYLSEGVRQVLAAQYDGWGVPAGAIMFEDQHAALLILSKGEKNTAIIVEDQGSGFEVVATNDAIIPDGVSFDEHWWISDKWDAGEPYIWYSPANTDQGFYCELRREEDSGWQVYSGSFGDVSEGTTRLAYEHANGDTALRVYGDSYFSAVYVPIEVDLSFSKFDPEGVKAFCAAAMTLKNKPALIPSTMEADALPQGQAVAFEKGQNYPVYAGPGEHFVRLGEYQDATVSTDGWIQVFGQEEGWLLIAYNLADGRNRFGYISAALLPEGADIPELRFTHRPGVLNAWITDDPVRTSAEVYLPVGTQCAQLATLGDGWAYIEITDSGQSKYRGFAPMAAVDLRESHAGKAIIQVESAPLYAGPSTEKPIGTYFGGVELEILQTQEGFSWVRIGNELASQEGWMLNTDLAMGAVPSDIPFALSMAVIVPPESDFSSRAYTEANQDAPRMNCDTYPAYSMLGNIGGFMQLASQSGAIAKVVFVPRDWAIPIPQAPNFYAEVSPVTLSEDCPVYVRPEQGAASHITLYKGTTVSCYPAGDWLLIADRGLAPWSCAEISTYGYIPAAVCRQTSDGIALPRVGRLEPANQGDNRWLYVSMDGNIDGIYGWGTRLLLLGETASRYLVRTPLGQYGFFHKADVTLTGGTAAQEGYASLFYGTARLAESTGYFQSPYVAAGSMRYDPGTEVRLLGCLGEWWSVAFDYQTGFLPAEALLALPSGVPAYDGIYNAFREFPLWLTWGTEPSIGFTDNEVWLLLREEDRPVLSHMQLRDGKWVEKERTEGLLGEGLRLISSFTFDTSASPMEFTLGCYLTDSNAELSSTFARTADSWGLIRFQMKEAEYLDEIGEQALYDRVILPQGGGLVIEENGRQYEVALAELPALNLERYSVKDMLQICIEAMK